MNKYFFFIFITLISFNFISAYGFDEELTGSQEGYDFPSSIITIEYLNSTVTNRSNIWITSDGDLDNINTDQFNNNAGTLELVSSYLNGLYCQLTGCTMTGQLNIDSNINVTGNLTTNGHIAVGTNPNSYEIMVADISGNNPGVMVGDNTDYNAYIGLLAGRILFGRQGSTGGAYFYNNDPYKVSNTIGMYAQLGNSFWIHPADYMNYVISEEWSNNNYGGNVKGGLKILGQLSDSNSNILEKSLFDIRGVDDASVGSKYFMRILDGLTHNSTALFVVNSSGSVGIGTATPSQKLDVNGSINISENATIGGLNINDGLTVGKGEAGVDYSIFFDGGTGDGFIRYNEGEDAIWTESKIGIGTSNPQSYFSIIEPTNSYEYRIGNNGLYMDFRGKSIYQYNKIYFYGTKGTGFDFYNGTGGRQGIFLYSQELGGWIWYAGGGDNDDRKLFVGIDSKVGINTVSPSYPLEVTGNVSGISIYSEANISATGYNTRTSVYDKTEGSALDLIKDADELIDIKGNIIHENFYGYAGKINVTDYSIPVIVEIFEEVCEDDICEDVIKEETTYPYKKEVGQVSLGSEIDVLRQAVYELKTENDLIKSELCKKDITYSWCK